MRAWRLPCPRVTNSVDLTSSESYTCQANDTVQGVNGCLVRPRILKKLPPYLFLGLNLVQKPERGYHRYTNSLGTMIVVERTFSSGESWQGSPSAPRIIRYYEEPSQPQKDDRDPRNG